jgi:hypothetical protein
VRLLPLVLTACLSSPDALLGTSPPPGLTVTDLNPGAPFTITATDMRPGESVGFLMSFDGVGNGPCPPFLGGACLTINAPFDVVGFATADADGIASLSGVVPQGAAIGDLVSFQAGQVASAGVSARLSGAVSAPIVGTDDEVYTTAEDSAPTFAGLQDVAALDATAVQLSWDAGRSIDDPASALTYQIFAGTRAAGIDWTTPVGTTAAGTTSLVLSSAQLPLLAPGAELVFGVRAVDTDGDSDTNESAVPFRLPPAGFPVVYVDQAAAAGGDGSRAAPFATLQAGVDAVSAGGIVLVAGGTYTETITVGGSAEVRIVGGFAGFAAPGAAGQLAARDADATPTILDGTGQNGRGLLDVTNTGATHLSGLTLTDFARTGIRAFGADLTLTGVDLVDTDPLTAPARAMDVQGTSLSAPISLRMYGVTIRETTVGVRLGGTLDELTVQSSRFHDLTSDAVRGEYTGQGPAGDTAFVGWDTAVVGNRTSIVLPAGGATDVTFAYNDVLRVESLLDAFDLSPEEPTNGNDLTIDIHHNRTWFGDSGDMVRVAGLAQVGVGGSSTFRYNFNDGLGISSDCFDLRLGGDGAYGPVDIEATHNVCRHTNSIGFDVGDLTAAAGETTRVVFHDNYVAMTESGGIEVDWFFDDAVNDRGTVELEIHDNTFVQNDDDIEVSVYGAEGVTNWVWVWNNDSRTSYNGFIFNDYSAQGTSAATSYWYVGFNQTTRGAEDCSYFRTSFGAYAMVTNNAIGWCDVDSSRALDIQRSAIGGGTLHLQNNVFALGAGSGIESDDGVYPQLVNNTIWGNGRESTSQYGVRGSRFDGAHEQIHIRNSIVSDNSGGDLPEGGPNAAGRVASTYSLVSDRPANVGFGNLTGDPLFTERGSGDDDFDRFFRLGAASPAIDAGDPAVAYLDADGSPNDLGAFGGPAGGRVGVIGGMSRPMEVIAISPHVQLHENAPMPSGTTPLTLAFTNALDPATVDATSVRVVGPTGAVAGAYGVSGRTVTFTPDAPWPVGADITVLVGDGVADLDGQANRYPWQRRFGTAPVGTDEVEPNDTLATANPLVGTHFDVLGILDGSVGDLQDVYRLDVTAPGQRLSTSGFCVRLGDDACDMRIALQDAGGNVVWTSTTGFATIEGNGNGDPYLDYTFAQPGTFHLVVTAVQSAFGPGPADSGLAYTPAYELKGWLR